MLLKRVLFILLILLLKYPVFPQVFYKGVDLSCVKELEGCPVQWKESSTVKDIFSIFKDNGANVVRFRIWHTPSIGKNGYADTEAMILRAKAKGLKVMLDFHYSDTWADAGKQKCPAAWIAVVNNNSVLADSLYNYTKKTLQALKNKGLLPEFVQVGNETNGGMCFPGTGTVTWPTDWSKQTLLFNAGIRAVRDVDANTRVILHVSDPQNAEWWAGQLNGNGVTGYDILGVSFYPTWHTTKTINDFGTIITSIKNTYQKDVMVVETGLPWTNSWDDNTTNIMNGAPANYGATPTPEIQAQWLIDLANKMAAAGGIGMIYWEPAWVASHVSGCPAESGGSAWENVALFDFNNNLQMNGGIRFFQLSTGISKPASLNENPSLTVFPNPVTNELIIQFNTQYNARVLVEIMDLQGRIIKTFTEKTVPGPNKFLVNISELKAVSGMYILHLSSDELSGNQRFILNR